MDRFLIRTVDSYDAGATYAALNTFFNRHDIQGDAAALYSFLLQFFVDDKITDEYGSFFFCLEPYELELQKHQGHRGFHDDKGTVEQLRLALATPDGNPIGRTFIRINPPTQWVDLSEEPIFRFHNHFQQCGCAKTTGKVLSTGPWCDEQRILYFLTDIPGAPGQYLLEFTREHF